MFNILNCTPKKLDHTTGRILRLEYSLRISRTIISSRDLSIMVFCIFVVLSNSLSSQRFFFPKFPSTNTRLGCFSMCWHQAGETNPWVWVIQKSLENANLKLKTPVGPLHAELSWVELANNDESFLPRTTKCEHSLTHLFPRQKHGNNKTKNRKLEWYNLIFPRHTHSKQNSTRTPVAQEKKRKKLNSKSQKKSRVKEWKIDHLYCRSSNTHYHHCSR